MQETVLMTTIWLTEKALLNFNDEDLQNMFQKVFYI